MNHGLLFRTILKIFQITCSLLSESFVCWPSIPWQTYHSRNVACNRDVGSLKIPQVQWICLPLAKCFKCLVKLERFCCHVDGTYLVCCYIRTFTCQLKIKSFFTSKTTCSVIVWTFTSSRFCKKLCCCNLFVPKPFSLVGIFLIKWAFHPNSWLGCQILQQIMDRILACSWNAFQCFQSFLL